MIKRDAYKQIVRAVDENRIPIVIGMRRIGKTTMLKQYKDQNPNSTLIMWDEYNLQVMDDIEFYNYIDNLCSKGGIFLFDEVQIRKNWDIIIKNMYDKYVANKKCKIIVTGSSSMILQDKDLGITRTEKILVDTWNFDEYLLLTNKDKSIEEFEDFLGYGFPEFMNTKKDFSEMINLTLKPILEDDIPKAYPKINTLALIRFIHALAFLTNGEVNETRLARKVGVTIVTIRNYVDILEKALIIKVVKKIHSNGTFPKKVSYKVYINPHIHLWILGMNFKSLEGKRKGHIIESYWLHWAKGINGFNKDFFYIKDSITNKEVDFVSLNNDGSFKTLHEFKYKDKIPLSEIKELITIKSDNKVIWCKENKVEHGLKYISILKINRN